RSNVSTKLTFVGGTLKGARLGYIKQTLWILLAAVGVVLLIALLNVGNLFLVRTEVRQRDVTIRKALGAAQGDVRRYFYTESFLLAGVAGTIATALAWAALRALTHSGPAALPRLHEIRLSGISILYIAGISIVAAIAFGSIPLWRDFSTSALHESGRGNTRSRRGHRVRY